MSYEITSDCVRCGDCEDECRIGAVSEGEDTYEINQEQCVECGACSYICTAGAIIHKQTAMAASSR